MCLIVLIVLGTTTACERDRKAPFDYPNISQPDHEGLDSLGMADFFDHTTSK